MIYIELTSFDLISISVFFF